MKRFIQLLTLTLLLLSLPIRSDTLRQTYSLEEEIIAQYIVETSKIYRSPMSYTAALSVAQTVYIQSQLNSVDYSTMLALMQAESAFNPKAKSSVGAVGLMQVWPKYHKRSLNGRNPYHPHVNVEVGIGIYRDCSIKSKSQYQTLKCYSGGASNHYHRRIAQFKKQIEHYAAIKTSQATVAYQN